MKFYVRDATGKQIAEYANRSELLSFLDASYPDATTDDMPGEVPGRQEVKDDTGKVVAIIESVEIPRP